MRHQLFTKRKITFFNINKLELPLTFDATDICSPYRYAICSHALLSSWFGVDDSGVAPTNLTTQALCGNTWLHSLTEIAARALFPHPVPPWRIRGDWVSLLRYSRMQLGRLDWPWNVSEWRWHNRVWCWSSWYNLRCVSESRIEKYNERLNENFNLHLLKFEKLYYMNILYWPYVFGCP